MTTTDPQPARVNSHHGLWLALILGAGLVGSGAAAWYSNWRTSQLQRQFDRRQQERQQLRDRDATLFDLLQQFESLVEQSWQQKDRLIREIAEHEQQLAILKDRTRQVERLGTELTALREALASYERSAQLFRASIDQYRSALVRANAGAAAKPGGKDGTP